MKWLKLREEVCVCLSCVSACCVCVLCVLCVCVCVCNFEYFVDHPLTVQELQELQDKHSTRPDVFDDVEEEHAIDILTAEITQVQQLLCSSLYFTWGERQDANHAITASVM